MEILIKSFIFITATEMGDKTQLLAFMLAAKFKRPWPIFWGIFVATVLNHSLAAYAGKYVTNLIPEPYISWVLSALFIGFGLWILIPDSDEGLTTESRFGPFLTTVMAFFLAEMGDKTQLSTVALAAEHREVLLVTIGTTLGMMASDGLAVFLGPKLTERLPMKYIHYFASAIFIIFGILILFK